MTAKKGRGLFACRNIKKGEFIIAEKAFISSHGNKLDEI